MITHDVLIVHNKKVTDLLLTLDGFGLCNLGYILIVITHCVVFRKEQDEWHVDNSMVSADSRQLLVKVVGQFRLAEVVQRHKHHTPHVLADQQNVIFNCLTLQRQLFQIAAVQRVQRHTGLTHYLIFDIWALWRSVLSARVPKCQKLKIVG